MHYLYGAEDDISLPKHVGVVSVHFLCILYCEFGLINEHIDLKCTEWMTLKHSVRLPVAGIPLMFITV